MWYGGDYNPEQWDKATIEKDLQLMTDMHINCVTVGVFSWTKLEPYEGEYQYEWLDDVLDRLYERKIDVILATPTTAMPFWLMQKYPEIMHVDIDGRRVQGGSREKICPNSAAYREYSRKIAGKLAERYAKHPAVKLWHINNEYHFYCYCPACAEAFREWLKKKYGTIDAVNKAWNTSFWGHTYSDFVQILPPSYLTDIKKNQLAGRDVACFQGLHIDYMRFMSRSVRNCIENEKAEIRKYSDLPVTNNFSNLVKTYDYWDVAKVLDVVSWDNYPTIVTPMYKPAFIHDLMRSLKDQPFYMMEQNPNNVSWEDYGPVKRPGEVADICWQSIAHGADSNLFFQWRQSRGAVEKFHGAMVPHSGRIDTRIGAELIELGEQFEKLGDIVKGAMPSSRVAVMFEWENWWALECSNIHNCYLKYYDQVVLYYRTFYELGISVDIVNEETCMNKDYDLIVAPCFYMCSPEFAEKVKDYIKKGGVFITTFLSGITDKTDNVILGGYPGAFREVLGIWVEEIDGMYPHMKNRVVLKDGSSYECGEICDLIRLEGARAIGLYGEDFYKGTPCITEHNYGEGLGCYIGTSPEYPLIKKLISGYCDRLGITRYDLPENVEMSRRIKGNMEYTFLMNHNNVPCVIDVKAEYREFYTGRKISGMINMNPRQCLLMMKI